jgi:hypothetical protein
VGGNVVCGKLYFFCLLEPLYFLCFKSGNQNEFWLDITMLEDLKELMKERWALSKEKGK